MPEIANALPFLKRTVIGKSRQWERDGPPEQLSVTLPVKPLAAWSSSRNAATSPPWTVSLDGIGVMVKAAITVRLWETGGAGANVALPDCEAWMVQVPGWARVAVLPDTVQMDKVSDVKLTGNLELAVAERVSEVPWIWLAGSLVKVMVCVFRITVTFCEVEAAA